MTDVILYTRVGSERKEIWSGRLAAIPRVGDSVVLNDGDTNYTVKSVEHWLAGSRQRGSVAIYAR